MLLLLCPGLFISLHCGQFAYLVLFGVKKDKGQTQKKPIQEIILI